MNSTSSDSGIPNGLNNDSSNGRANFAWACFLDLEPVAPRKYRIAVRAASTVVNMEGLSVMTFLANVRDGVLGNCSNRSWTYAQAGDNGRGLMVVGVFVCRTPTEG